MDVLNLNPVQGAASAAAGIAMDAALPDDPAAGTDFSALLALGLNSCAPDAREPRAQEDTKAETAIAADAQGSLPTPELLIALPQQVPNTPPAGAATPDQPQSEVPAAKPAQAPLPAGAVASTRTAAVADDAANIAASGPETAQASQPQGRIQNADQRVDPAAAP